MKYVISYSGGLGSFMAAYLTVKEHGRDSCALIFTDTCTEDEDLYRFLDDTSKWLDVPLTRLADGRDIWEVFTDERFHGNSRVDPCSKILKRKLFRRHLNQHYSPTDTTVIVGIGANEAHRMRALTENFIPYFVFAPLCETEVSREDILDVLDAAGIEPPRLYEMGFPHNNCGGFCVKTGQRQMKLLLEKMPERYAWHESQQERLFAHLGKRHGFIKKQINNEMHYLSLREFREDLESGGKPDLYVSEGCGCFA